MTFVEDRGLRARVYEAAGTRASDQGPHAGRFDNSERIARTLKLRREAAGLLGFQSPVEWSLATKMASDGEEVIAFLRDIAARAKPSAERDLEAVLTFAAENLGLDHLEPWGLAFASNRMRERLFSLEEEAVRAYFPVEQVIEGWQGLVSYLFGVRLVERADVDLWSPDAAFFDLVDAGDQVIAGLYIDLHARAGKRGGAWMAPARPRLDDGDLVGKPVAYGDRRAFLVWERLILPNGKSLILGSEPGVDAQGAIGVRGQVDRRLFPLLVGTLFAGAVTTLGQMARDDSGRDSGGWLGDAGDAAAIEGAQVGGRLVDRELEVRPSIRLRPGAPVRVMITRDLILEPYRS